MRVAYADPPYLGLAQKLYGHLHPDAAEYDKPETHQALIDRLVEEYPDGWALSLHLPSLRTILQMCPEDIRILAWVKTWVPFKPRVKVAYAWEPVIVRGGRTRTKEALHIRDWLACPIAQNLRNAVKGTKPVDFCFWLFEVLGLEPEDTFDDLFPGSGAVSRAWQAWASQKRLSLFPVEGESLVLLPAEEQRARGLVEREGER